MFDSERAGEQMKETYSVTEMFATGVCNINRDGKPGPVTMLSDRPLIVPEIQGRSRDDPVEAHFPFENDHFRDLLDRPPLDTISNI